MEVGGEGGGSGGGSYIVTHLVSDRGDIRSTSSTWLYRQQDLKEKDCLMNQIKNDKAVCSPGYTGSVNYMQT